MKCAACIEFPYQSGRLQLFATCSHSAGMGGGYSRPCAAFPARCPKTPALRQLGYSKKQMTAHGFKGMASTRLNEMGCWNPDTIERQLAHQESDDVRCAYMHAAEYWPERVKMMQAWADYLEELRDAGKVIPLRRENA